MRKNIKELIPIIRLLIPLILASKKLFILAYVYVILLTIYLVFKNKKVIKKNITTFFCERKNLKNLKYYHITDDNKTIDMEKRKNTFSLLKDMGGTAIVIFFFNFFPIYFLAQKSLEDSWISNSLLWFAVIFIFLGYGGFFIEIIYKYTTAIYLFIPIIGTAIYFTFVNNFLEYKPVFIKLTVFLVIVMLLYLLLSAILPIHILRHLNGRTVLISSFLTIATTFLGQIVSYFFSQFLHTSDYLLTARDIEKATDVSNNLKKIILENTELIKVMNDFYEKEVLRQLTVSTNLIMTALTFSFIIGGLIITKKIKNNNKKAKKLYRSFIKDNSKINYTSLVQCAFYGGEEYENLILNNELMSKIVLENESNIIIPKISIKKRFVDWCKGNHFFNSIIKEFKRIFSL